MIDRNCRAGMVLSRSYLTFLNTDSAGSAARSPNRARIARTVLSLLTCTVSVAAATPCAAAWGGVVRHPGITASDPAATLTLSATYFPTLDPRTRILSSIDVLYVCACRIECQYGSHAAARA